MKSKVLCVIMGGGRGTRLCPLTKKRCKPAVPLAGKYRLIDIPISNCLNSGYNRIYILTQFKTASLHRHINETYRFDSFGKGYIDILAAEQTEHDENWYQGTADAVRQNLSHFTFKDEDLFIILSGDQLYRMDFREMINHHNELKADVTIASTMIPKERACNFGIMRVDGNYEIKEFVEKPKSEEAIERLIINNELCDKLKEVCKLNHCLASMGIYVFKAKVLREALEFSGTDFGKEIIPALLGKVRLCSYVFDGYWEDIGTIKAFFNVNLMLTDAIPAFNFYDSSNSIYTNAKSLPGTKVDSCTMKNTLIAEGCIISDAVIERSVIGLRSIIREGSQLKNVLLMGNDKYDCMDKVGKNIQPGLGIGKNCKITNAIIDKNVRIGNNVHLSPEGKADGFTKGNIYVRDGILIVLYNTVIPDNTQI
ncbi:MAG: glucose-1-phosphate adenylyltransferase [Verrucomicrobia bacterium]|nr:MAG: glucose-1-phosphate adenylyltransferase [Verrucomicrobiota bacterium]